MHETLDIDYNPEQMQANLLRLQARNSRRYADRVPVGFCLEARFFTPLFGMPYRAFFANAREQYHWTLQFLKMRIEQIPEDIVCCSPTLTVRPYFDNVIDSDALGAQTVYPENETLHAIPTIRSVEQMEAFEVPPPDAGLWGVVRDWWSEMRTLAEATRLTFNGHPGRVEVAPLTGGALSPFSLAVDLVGVDFYAWILEYPEACHVFLDKITTALLANERYFRSIDPRPRGGYGMAEDSALILSEAQFRQFCVPYDLRLYEAIGGDSPYGRGMHMCGDSRHLHRVLVEDLQITSFDVFGYVVEPEVVAANLGGRTLLWGNIDPMLMKDGTPAAVRAAADHALQVLAPCGGFMLGDGANVCPGTPLRNLAVLTEAAEAYGVPEGDLQGA